MPRSDLNPLLHTIRDLTPLPPLDDDLVLPPVPEVVRVHEALPLLQLQARERNGRRVQTLRFIVLLFVPDSTALRIELRVRRPRGQFVGRSRFVPLAAVEIAPDGARGRG
jgi:hypothetical protein